MGFLFLSISFLIHAVQIESILLKSPVFNDELNNLLFVFTRIPGYLLIIISLILDPLQEKPHYRHKISEGALLGIGSTASFLSMVDFIFPVLASLCGLLYLKRATIGLENHLKAVGISFFILGIFEAVSIGAKFRGSENIDVYNLVSSFGWVWIGEHLVLLSAVLVLGRWVFGYLLKRLQSQLFMIFTALILVIFLLTTVSFTGLLIRNLQQETLSRLETDVKVLNFAVEARKNQSLSDTQVLALNPQVISYVTEKNKQGLYEIASSFLLNKNQSFLVVTSETGQVLARGEDKERIGDSLSDDPMIRRALLGESVTSVVSKEGAIAPEVSVRSASPIKNGESVTGVVMTGSVIDNAFVDGLKSATGLETAVFGDNKLSATTLVSPDGKSRSVGIKEENGSVKQQVLTRGENYSGPVNFLNVPYFAAYMPLKDVDNTPVGMLFVGQMQIGVLQSAGRSIELTFIMTALLIVLSVIPSFLISRYLSGQIK